MQEMPKAKNHTVMLDNRGKLVMTGTEDVSGFNEETVSVKTSCGCLVIKGENLHIDKLNLETGDVSIDGKINAMQYLGNGAQNPNFQNSLSRCNLGADFCTAVNRISLFTCIRSGGRIAV